MLLRHKKIPQDLFVGKKVLDIGCGRKKLPGAIGVDHAALPNVDIVADLNKILPFEDNSFDAVYSDQVIEHVKDLVSLVYEVYRILKPGGFFLAHAPYFRSSWAHIDPTHVRSFNICTMDQFVKGTWLYEGYRFREEGFASIQVFIDTDYPSTALRSLLSFLALRRPFKFENSWLSCLYPFEQVSYLMRK